MRSVPRVRFGQTATVMRRNMERQFKLSVRGHFGRLPKPERWAFIVGCYNSGTTLLHSLIASHRDVGSLPAEGQFLTDQLPIPKADGLDRRWALNEASYRLTERREQLVDVTRLKRQWGAAFNDPMRAVLIEKSPPNAARTRWLQTQFEPAYFVGLIRNGYAVAEGIARKGSISLTQAALQWARSNEIMLADWPSLEHKLLLRYEELAESPKDSLLKVFSFLRLDPDRFDWSVLEQPRRIHERLEPVRNLNSASLSALSENGRLEIEHQAMGMLKALGYEC